MELQLTAEQTIAIDARRYIGATAPLRHISETLSIAVNAHCFLPRDDDLQADWVATVAVPAFRRVAALRRPRSIRSFCSIGTGSALDALAAAEILEPQQIVVTDVHEDVVEAARRNLRTNLKRPHAVELVAETGDLFSPLTSRPFRFDVVYENLPNLPLAGDTADLGVERTSSGFLAHRNEPIPPAVRDALLSLHYLALLQAKPFLAGDGVVLSMLGGRVSLRSFLQMAEQAGYRSSFLSFGWKVQAQAEEILTGHAHWQDNGLGPFHFYPIDDLNRVFADVDPLTAGGRALEIEQALAPYAIDAHQAVDIHRSGGKVGHTYVVLQSQAE
jgi:hypothetical protein